MNKEQALQILRKNRAVLTDTYGVRRIGLFGSIVKDRLTSESDIDIVVEIETEKKKLHNFLSLRRYLEEQLGRPVDLGLESALKPVIRDEVLMETTYV
jgi:predicted nucleotidyltransferase